MTLEPHPELDPDDLPPGTRLCGGRFVIEACLGRGGVATVYRVRSSDGRRLALKLMVSRRAADGDQRQRFDNEWLIGKALRDRPYVVSVEQAGRHDDGRPCFTMELVEAPTLAELIAHHELTTAGACRVARAVADALHDLHERGVVHRDIKPDNIMVTADGVRLLDFGYAFTRGSVHVPRTAGLTTHEHRPGTLLYMAPEQAEGAPPAPSFDVYALAATLHEALVGHAPYSDLPPAMMMWHKCAGAEGEPSIVGRTVGLGKRLEQLVDEGLRRRPEERLRSAAVFRDRLDVVLAEMGDQDFPVGLPVRPERAAGVIEPEDENETMAFLPSHRLAAVPMQPAVVAAAGVERPEVAGAEREAIASEQPIVIPRELHAASGRRKAAHDAKGAAERAEPQSRLHEVGAKAEAKAAGKEREATATKGSSRTWLAAAVVLLLLGVGGWWELAREPKQAGAAPASVGVQVEPKPVPVLDVEVAAEPEPTPSAEPETKVAPVRDPLAEPAPEAVPELEPSKTRRKPKPSRQPVPALAAEEPCTDVAAEAKVASRDKQWSRVLGLTASSRCWVNDTIRRRVRAKALMESGRLAECVKFGAADADADVQRLATLCATQLEEAGSQ